MELSFPNGKKRFIHLLTDRYQVLNNQIEWRKDGKLHRVNGPAYRNQYFHKGIKHSFGSPSIMNNIVEWYVNGKLHKVNEPANSYNSDEARFYLYGRMCAYKGEMTILCRNNLSHSDHGPSRIELDGIQYWHMNGELHREDGPAVVYPSGDQYWYVHDELHRIDGPAIITKDGTQYWYANDELHREDGPAVINADGTQEFWIQGEQKVLK